MAPPLLLATSFSDLEDLTGKTTPIVTLISRDNFSNEFRYEIKVKNLSSDPLLANSVVIVLEKIINLAGQDRDPLNKEPLLNQMEILNQDGTTPEGQPFYRIPMDENPEVPAYSQSQPVTVRLRNPSYTQGIRPSFRIYGTVKKPTPSKNTVEEKEQTITPPNVLEPTPDESLKRLIQLLINKGIMTQEEWQPDDPSSKRQTP